MLERDIDVLWTLISAVLVLLMQGGFLCLESGLTRSKNSINVALKNLLDFGLSLLLFWLLGFGLMFGFGASGWIGASRFAPDIGSDGTALATFFLFQAMFCATAATIVSGAVAERFRFNLYLGLTAVVVVLIYPVSGHWAWGGVLDGTAGWLAGRGFVDFAGSTVVHSVGGWIALAAVLTIGPRIGRFGGDGSRTIAASNLPLAMLGVMLFVVGWIGFNGGSTLAFDDNVTGIIANTLLAAAAGTSAGYVLSTLFPSGAERVSLPLNGTLAGLVAVTASCHAVSAAEAVLIGGVGAGAMVACEKLLVRLEIDDAINAIPVHLAAGVWGTLAVALFGEPAVLGTGLGWGDQLVVQGLGIAVCGTWAFSISWLFLTALKRLTPLRLNPEAERIGLNVSEHDARTELFDLLDAMNHQARAFSLTARLPVELDSDVGLIAAQHNRVMDALQSSVARTQSFVDTVDDAIINYEPGGKITGCNPGAERIFGQPRSSLYRRGLGLLFDGSPPEALWQPGAARELAARHASGAELPLEITVTSHELGGKTLYTAQMRDIRQRRLLEDQLRDQKEQAELTLNSIADGVIVTDAWGQVRYLNPVAESLTGWSLAEAVGTPLNRIFRVVHATTLVQYESIVRDCLERQALQVGEDAVHVDRRGDKAAIRLSASPMGGAAEQRGVVIVFSDVSTERRLQRRLSWQASHDQLTGLTNRASFEQHAQAAIAVAHSEQRRHCLMFVDLDQFKIINDTAGHLAGDDLLRKVAQLIERTVRDGDIVARIGGDEFGVLLMNCAQQHASRVADKLVRSLGEFRFIWKNNVFPIGASIGLVEINQQRAALERVLAAADTACYAAKDAGRNCVRVYSEDNAEMSDRHGQMRWVSRIQQALEHGEFVLYRQPIAPIVASEHRQPHEEILIRLRDASGKVLPPGAFLPAAERYGLATTIDRWVVSQVLARMQRQYEAQGARSLPRCFVNLSGASVGDPEFAVWVVAQLTRHRALAGFVNFEITETAAIANLEHARKLVTTLRAKGCQVALDDFGSGLSSFAYLKNLPVDYLKIDGVFIRDLQPESVDLAIVQSIHAVASRMGLKTIAEYVESTDTIALLRDVGIDYVQGYGIARPSPFVLAGEAAHDEAAPSPLPAIAATRG